jgi:hypothetical protein
MASIGGVISTPFPGSVMGGGSKEGGGVVGTSPRGGCVVLVVDSGWLVVGPGRVEVAPGCVVVGALVVVDTGTVVVVDTGTVVVVDTGTVVVVVVSSGGWARMTSQPPFQIACPSEPQFIPWYWEVPP